MIDVDEDFGKLNSKAPAELSRFAFLIGKWHCEARLMSATGTWQTYKAAWLGRFILDGYVIADEYRMWETSGELIVLGMNFRSYDADKQKWNIYWLNGLAGNWINLVPEELGGVRISDRSISYTFKEPAAGHTYSRATYMSHSKMRFTWRGEKSDNGKSWSEFMVIEAHRDE